MRINAVAIKKGSYLEEVREQYEDYPYPARDPEAEKGVIYSANSSSLDCINHYCFEGKRDLSKNFRVLVAGGGTGDCTIYFAEQFRDTEAELVYLDMSTASMTVAKARAKVRKLDNITWVHDSILNLPNLDLGKFDYISCTGVLHHLADPQAGLNALKSVLAEDGSIFLMLYGLYGRLGIYQMQDTLKRLNAGFESIEDSIQNTKKVIKNLPSSNWFAANSQTFTKDLATDIGVFDLLLHSQDRAYTVPQLYDYVEASDLSIHKLYNPDNVLGDLVFQPNTFIKDEALLSVIANYPFREQAAICEGLFGKITMQNCFISFQDKSPPSVDDLDLIPNLSVEQSRNESVLKQAFADKRAVRINQLISIQPTPHTEAIFNAIDGKRTSLEIIELVLKNATDIKSTYEQVLAEYKKLYDGLVKVGKIYLRAANIPKYKTIPEMTEKMVDSYGKKACEQALAAHISKSQAT
jgi:ubiquinone/menaquinone biosynthesis C-methylase UbiE